MQFQKLKYIVPLCLLTLSVGCQSTSSTPTIHETPIVSTTQATSTPSPTPTPTPTPTPAPPLTLKATAILEAPSFQKGTPVFTHGALEVNGIHIIDKNSEVFQLRGVSTHGIQWYSQYTTEETFKTLRDDWQINAIRLALYADTESRYPENQEAYTTILENAITAATNLGLYVIVDWHILADGDPLLHQEDASTFFDYFSTKYQNYPNLIFELCNEPNGGKVSWDESIKPYADTLLKVIRKNSPNTLVIVGTPKWCQSPLSVVRNRIDDPQVVYAFHFYANSHKDPLRETLENAIVKYELPLFVSEFGTCDASGTGDINIEQSNTWLDLLDQYQISWMNWSLCDKDESSALLVPNASSANWSDEALTENGHFIKARLQSYTK